MGLIGKIKDSIAQGTPEPIALPDAMVFSALSSDANKLASSTNSFGTRAPKALKLTTGRFKLIDHRIGVRIGVD